MSLKRRLHRGFSETGKFIGFHAQRVAREYAEKHFGPISHEERKAYLEGYRSGALERARELGRQRSKLIGEERREIRRDEKEIRKDRKRYAKERRFEQREPLRFI